MSKEPKDKTPPPVSTEQQPERSSKTRVFRNLSLAEARERAASAPEPKSRSGTMTWTWPKWLNVPECRSIR
jgi:hypothetical protein